jgi:pyruvate dehydrogenase E2 component (dihydrolipoamide acetyltransferase)
MPSLGADMEAGTLVEWLVKPGAPVKRGDIIAVVDTQKGAIEIEVYDDGTIDRFLVDVGARVPVGTPLAVIQSAGAPARPPPLLKPALPAAAAHLVAPARGEPIPGVAPGERVRASPAARRLAMARGIDLGDVRGSGPGGAVLVADIEAAPRAGLPTDETARRRLAPELGQMRSAIAAAMSRSKREIPHYYLAQTLDMAPAQQWVSRANAERPPENRLLIGALFVKATARAARTYPEFNGFFQEQRFQQSAAIHVGVAIALRGGGLVAPAIHNAADLDLDALMARMRDLVGRVRGGRFRSSEIADPTITVSSLGERGVEALFGVIYPPQVAIVGFGKIVERPWISAGGVLARPTVTATLAADHRVSDGHRGALFLAEIERLLQRPEAL